MDFIATNVQKKERKKDTKIIRKCKKPIKNDEMMEEIYCIGNFKFKNNYYLFDPNLIII